MDDIWDFCKSCGKHFIGLAPECDCYGEVSDNDTWAYVLAEKIKRKNGNNADKTHKEGLCKQEN